MAIQRDKVIANAEKLVAKGKIDAAIKEYERLLDDNPNDVNTLNRIGDLWVRINRNDEAVKEYDRVGRMLLKRGMLDEAVQVFRKALKIDARNIELVESLVTALLEAKDYDNALQIVDTSLESNRENPRLIGIWGKIQL